MEGELASLSLSEVWFVLVAGWQCQPPSSRFSPCTSPVERISLMTWLYWHPCEQEVWSLHQWSWRLPVRAWASLGTAGIWWHIAAVEEQRRGSLCPAGRVKHPTKSCPHSHKGLELRKLRDTATGRITFSEVGG